MSRENSGTISALLDWLNLRERLPRHDARALRQNRVAEIGGARQPAARYRGIEGNCGAGAQQRRSVSRGFACLHFNHPQA
jgi:hypothetical protein